MSDDDFKDLCQDIMETIDLLDLPRDTRAVTVGLARWLLADAQEVRFAIAYLIASEKLCYENSLLSIHPNYEMIESKGHTGRD